MQSILSYPAARSAPRRSRLVAFYLITSAAAHATLGIWWCWLQASAFEHPPFRAAAAVLLLFMAGVQIRLAIRAWKYRPGSAPVGGARWRLYLRWLSVGVILCYGSCLLLGQEQGAPYLFAASMALWHTLSLLPLVASPALLDRTLTVLARRWVRRSGWTLYALLMTPLCMELGLRGYDLVATGPAGANYLLAQQKLTPGTEYRGRRVNTHGYWDDEFSSTSAEGVFRVAALGGEVALGNSQSEHFFSRIEQDARHVEVYNFALPGASPGDYAVRVARDVLPFRPQLVLAFVSVGDDLMDQPAPSVFDWQWLHTAQLGAEWLLQDAAPRARHAVIGGLPLDLPASVLGNASAVLAQSNPDEITTAEVAVAVDPYQRYLQETIAQLAVCRTPIEAPMKARWEKTFRALDRLIETCRNEGVTLALVVTPGDFQVNPVLRDVLRRRAGLSAEDLDIDLPQRRLSAYARQREVPLVDLTPHFQLCEGQAFARYDRCFSDTGHTIAADVVGHFVQSHQATILAGAP